MQFEAVDVQGAWAIDPGPVADGRGRFMRAWCRREFVEHSVEFQPVQGNMAYSIDKGTMRGLHYQVAPALEAHELVLVGEAFLRRPFVEPGEPQVLIA